jgi:hypothetical protein
MSEENKTETPPSISLNDLAVILQLIDVCAQRGAFQGSEMKDIGILRERIHTFVEANKPEEEEEKPAED